MFEKSEKCDLRLHSIKYCKNVPWFLHQLTTDDDKGISVWEYFLLLSKANKTFAREVKEIKTLLTADSTNYLKPVYSYRRDRNIFYYILRLLAEYPFHEQIKIRIAVLLTL